MTPTLIRRTAALTACAALALSGPASAQLFWQPADLSTPPITGAEPVGGINLPEATPKELQAGLVWHLRAALNVAALQCDFEPTLLTTSNYNAMLAHHRTELGGSFTTLASYFKRVNGPVAGQKLFDQYGTRTYSSYSVVQAQLEFCQTAGKVGREAIFAPRGSLYKIAQSYIGELRRSMIPTGDRVYGNPGYGFIAKLPPLDATCWKNGELVKKCVPTWEQANAR